MSDNRRLEILRSSVPIQGVVSYRFLQNGAPSWETSVRATLPTIEYFSAASADGGVALANPSRTATISLTKQRYHRVDRDTLELTMTLTDPKVYTKPWVSDRIIWTSRPNQDLREEICAPIDEQFFNENLRNPAGGKVQK